MPTTRSRGNPLVSIATWHIASSGLATTTRIVSGECSTTSSVTLATMFWFVLSRSSRLIPGLRGLPLVMTTTSEPAVSS